MTDYNEAGLTDEQVEELDLRMASLPRVPTDYIWRGVEESLDFRLDVAFEKL